VKGLLAEIENLKVDVAHAKVKYYAVHEAMIESQVATECAEISLSCERVDADDCPAVLVSCQQCIADKIRERFKL
jgi:hypothetical protein